MKSATAMGRTGESANRGTGESETPASSPFHRFTDSPSRRFNLVVVGASLGGLDAVSALLAGLPVGFPLPVVIVQHRAHDSDKTLADFLDRRADWPVAQPCDKDPIVPGHVYLARADYHLLVDAGAFALSLEGPVERARPSVDVLFESAAAAYGPGVIAVILTGAGRDGAVGAARVAACGGCVIVQDPATAEARAMPEAALAAVPAARVLPLPEIIRALNELTK